MVTKQTWVHASDNTNVRWLRIFHLYKGFDRRASEVGFFVKGSARVVEPPRLEYKGFKFKFNKRGDVCRALLVRGIYPRRRLDGSVYSFPTNSGVLIRKRQNVKSKYLQGPSSYHLRRKKFKALFQYVL